MKKECFIFTSDENTYGSIYKVLLNDILSKGNVTTNYLIFLKKFCLAQL